MKIMLFCINRHGARDVLKLMHEKGLEIVGCVFEDERPNLLSEMCSTYGIPTYTTVEMYDALEKDVLPRFDLGISYLYSKLLRESIIEFAPKGIINFHPAPVSVHKGLGACCYCLLNGFKKWAVTAHYVSAKFDEGDVIEEHWFPIEGDSTAFKVEQRVQRESVLLFKKIIKKILNGETLPRCAQAPGEGTYFSRKDLEKIKDVTGIQDVREIDKRIRALWFPPYHGAFVTIGGKRYSLVSSDLLKEIAELYEKEVKSD